MEQLVKLPVRPAADSRNIIQGENYRITMLTEGLVRLEYSEDGIFEDRATQTVINRDFPAVDYQVKETPEELEILTWRFRLTYDKKEFNPRGLRIHVTGNTGSGNDVWHYGDPVHDLKGTARTLDTIDGACELGSGLVSRDGFTVLDDSASLILTEEGWVSPRKKRIKDIYFWGRPSCAGDGYDATSSAGSNKATTNPEYLKEVESRIDTFLVKHPYLKREEVPADIVTASASGLDPDISVASAYVQVKRVAEARGMSEEAVKAIVEKVKQGPLLGMFGPSKVNVLKLNMALDEKAD